MNAEQKSEAYIQTLEDNLNRIQQRAQTYPVRPRVYFEEWWDPIISGIGWVSDLIHLAGGEDCFADNAAHAGGAQRIIANPQTVVDRQPDIIISSWCGRRFQPHKVGERAGWEDVPAVVNGDVHEVKSAIILQPGPAALSDGVTALDQIIHDWVKRRA